MIDSSHIQRLLLGHFTMPDDSSLPRHKIVVCAFVIHHPTGPVLFDSGLGPHPESDRRYRPVIRDLRRELLRAGTAIEDIRAVVNCHLHVDHAGGNPNFPGRPIFAQPVEVDAAQDWDYTNPSVVDFEGVSLELHDGEADVADGIRIIPTPGHTTGHQSLVIDTRGGRVVLAGQAFNDASEYARAAFASELTASGDRVEVEIPPWMRTLREEIDPVRVVFAHDLAVWERQADSLSR